MSMLERFSVHYESIVHYQSYYFLGGGVPSHMLSVNNN